MPFEGEDSNSPFLPPSTSRGVAERFRIAGWSCLDVDDSKRTSILGRRIECGGIMWRMLRPLLNEGHHEAVDLGKHRVELNVPRAAFRDVHDEMA